MSFDKGNAYSLPVHDLDRGEKWGGAACRIIVDLVRDTATPIQKAKVFSSERSCGRQLSLLEKLVGR